jgi:hypothetical protein
METEKVWWLRCWDDSQFPDALGSPDIYILVCHCYSRSGSSHLSFTISIKGLLLVHATHHIHFFDKTSLYPLTRIKLSHTNPIVTIKEDSPTCQQRLSVRLLPSLALPTLSGACHAVAA